MKKTVRVEGKKTSINSILSLIGYNVDYNGGSSLNNKMKPPTSGYMVSIKAFEIVKDGDKQLTNNEFYHLWRQIDLIDNRYIGAWHNEKNGKTYYDVSVNIEDFGTAMLFADNQEQLAIYDVKAQRVLETKL